MYITLLDSGAGSISKVGGSSCPAQSAGKIFLVVPPHFLVVPPLRRGHCSQEGGHMPEYFNRHIPRKIFFN